MPVGASFADRHLKTAGSYALKYMMSATAIAIGISAAVITKTGKGALLEALPNLVTASFGFRSLRSYVMLRISSYTLWLSSHHSTRYLRLKVKI